MRYVVGNYLPHGTVGHLGWSDERVVIGDLIFGLQLQLQRCLSLHRLQERGESTLVGIQGMEAVGNLLEEHWRDVARLDMALHVLCEGRQEIVAEVG